MLMLPTFLGNNNLTVVWMLDLRLQLDCFHGSVCLQCAVKKYGEEEREVVEEEVDLNK